MKKILLFTLLISIQSFGQIKGASFTAKEFSKDIALFKAKEFLFRDVFISNNEVVQFETIPLAASNSGELTTLLYRCDSKNLDGLILGFYGNYWNGFDSSWEKTAFERSKRRFEKKI